MSDKVCQALLDNLTDLSLHEGTMKIVRSHMNKVYLCDLVAHLNIC